MDNTKIKKQKTPPIYLNKKGEIICKHDLNVAIQSEKTLFSLNFSLFS